VSDFGEPPAAAAWWHVDTRSGFEVVHFRSVVGGYGVDGTTAAVEDGRIWSVSYSLELDRTWRTRHAEVVARSATGECRTTLEADGAGHWSVDAVAARRLDGCLDVDLESSAMTNALPVRRLGLHEGERADAPAAYVRLLDLAVERLEQTYVRSTDDGDHQRYDYAAPAFDLACVLVYDESGLVIAYPGIATRAA